MGILIKLHRYLEGLSRFNYIGFLLLRLYLFYVFWNKGTYKIDYFNRVSEKINFLSSMVSELIAWLLISIEIGCAISFLIGLFVRWSAAILFLITFSSVLILFWKNSWEVELEDIEMSLIYLGMLATLLFSGGGKYLSLDYWVSRR